MTGQPSDSRLTESPFSLFLLLNSGDAFFRARLVLLKSPFFRFRLFIEHAAENAVLGLFLSDHLQCQTNNNSEFVQCHLNQIAVRVPFRFSLFFALFRFSGFSTPAHIHPGSCFLLCTDIV
jgi:hypothetical protein